VAGVDLPVIDLDPDLHPWDRQPTETPLRYAQFRNYLDRGRGRTLRQVSESLARNARYVRAISAAYRWVERAEAWDRHRDRLDELAWLDARREAAEQDATVLRSALGKVAKRLTTLDPDDMDPGDTARMLDVVMRWRRALFGEPTSVVSITGPAGGAPDGFAAQVAALAGMPPSARAATIAELTKAVMMRASAAAGAPDDDE
jgi:hypothetical protein